MKAKGSTLLLGFVHSDVSLLHISLALPPLLDVSKLYH